MYVDDILISGNNDLEIQFLKKHLHDTFTIKDLGELHYFLGIEVSKINDSFILTQHKYTKELLHSSGVSTFKKAVTPLPLNVKLSAKEGLLFSNQHCTEALLKS